jgi:transcription termination factor Rho
MANYKGTRFREDRRRQRDEDKSETDKNNDGAPESTAYDPEDEEPLSLAEELAEEAARGDDTDDRYEKIKQGEIHIAELQKMSMSQLIEEARQENLTEVAGMKRQDLIFKILKERVKMNGLMYGEGTLEVLPDGFGFLRSPEYHYLSCPDDIYVSPSQIRRFGLQTGATVRSARPKKTNAISRCSASRPSTIRIPTCSRRKCLSTT